MMSTALRPLIAICGTTGVGKSKLAVELALALRARLQVPGGTSMPYASGARIINADAMQVYAGLDILTNKIPESERMGIEHLLMGFKSPGEQYVVGQWVQDAVAAIDETHKLGQIPIVVGGTSYWIQHLIFQNRLVTTEPSSIPTPSSNAASGSSGLLESLLSNLSHELRQLYDNLPDDPPLATSNPEAAFALHNLLTILDPQMASRWHWKDTRKVLRSLEIIRQTGQRPSEIITAQKNIPATPRYKTLFFWLYAEPAVLNPRLDTRVDQMLEQGLLDEVRELESMASHSRSPSPTVTTSDADPDYTLGIYQSIGYREFHGLLQGLESDDYERKMAQAVDRMKTSTRQYAKRQVSWLKNKLLPAVHDAAASGINDTVTTTSDHADVALYLLDATQLGNKWDENVNIPANQLVQAFFNNEPILDPLTLSDNARRMLDIKNKSTDPTAVFSTRRKVTCPTCTTDSSQPVMIEAGGEWDAHIKTKAHKALAAKEHRKAMKHVYEEEAEQKRLERARRRAQA